MNLNLVAKMMNGGGPPGLGGSSSGAIAYSGFGHVGAAGRCYTHLAQVYLRAGEVRDAVENDQLNIEKCVKEVAALLVDTVQATGKMFEEEHMRMISMVTSVHL